MRKASKSDFYVEVDGVGRFSFARRSPQDVYRIRTETNTLTDGFEDKNGNMDLGAFMFATLKVLMVSAPEGFAGASSTAEPPIAPDLNTLDPVMDDTWEDKIINIYKALRDKELSFRPRPVEAVQRAGPGHGDDVPIEVPPPV
jgi:hypothetical protein